MDSLLYRNKKLHRNALSGALQRVLLYSELLPASVPCGSEDVTSRPKEEKSEQILLN